MMVKTKHLLPFGTKSHISLYRMFQNDRRISNIAARQADHVVEHVWCGGPPLLSKFSNTFCVYFHFLAPQNSHTICLHRIYLIIPTESDSFLIAPKYDRIKNKE